MPCPEAREILRALGVGRTDVPAVAHRERWDVARGTVGKCGFMVWFNRYGE
jgi:hypothetical protein